MSAVPPKADIRTVPALRRRTSSLESSGRFPPGLILEIGIHGRVPVAVAATPRKRVGNHLYGFAGYPILDLF